MSIVTYIYMCVAFKSQAFFALKPSYRKLTTPRVFRVYPAKVITEIFPIIANYVQAKRIEEDGVDDRLRCDQIKRLADGAKYAEMLKDRAVYMGWCPYNKYHQNIPIINNDNDEDMEVYDIPLYFIFLEPKQVTNVENNTTDVFVEKIIKNPSIDVDINPKTMYTHFKDLENKSNMNLDLSKLKYFDSGRFYLEFQCNAFDVNYTHDKSS